jgi:hypothetical protein
VSSHSCVSCSKQTDFAIIIEILHLRTKQGIETMHGPAAKQSIQMSIVNQHHQPKLPQFLTDVGKIYKETELAAHVITCIRGDDPANNLPAN